jgi:hypothetical protein
MDKIDPIYNIRNNAMNVDERGDHLKRREQRRGKLLASQRECGRLAFKDALKIASEKLDRGED